MKTKYYEWIKETTNHCIHFLKATDIRIDNN